MIVWSVLLQLLAEKQAKTLGATDCLSSLIDTRAECENSGLEQKNGRKVLVRSQPAHSGLIHLCTLRES